MKNILYIHGLNSSANSSTGVHVREYMKKNYPGYKVITLNHDLLNPASCARDLKNLVTSRNINLVIASSLGAFYALTLGDMVPKILVNPCMKPSVEIPKLVPELDKNVVNEFVKLEQHTYNMLDAEAREYTFAAFGTNDELFSYKLLFKSKFWNRFITLNGQKHRLTPSALDEVLDTFMPRVEVLKESTVAPMFESYVNLYKEDPKMNNFEKYKDEVYEILEKSYAPVGGMFGIDNPDDLVEEANFWKLWREGGKIIAATIYKLKNGKRKLAYLGSDGTDRGKAALTKILEDDLRLIDRKMWVETSHGVEKKFSRMGATPIPAHVVADLMPGKEIKKNTSGWLSLRSLHQR